MALARPGVADLVAAPAGNFDRIPVVLSGPYEYGVKDAPPVADLNPPAGVLTAAIAQSATVRAEA